jgi:hypothetical protein
MIKNKNKNGVLENDKIFHVGALLYTFWKGGFDGANS